MQGTIRSYNEDALSKIKKRIEEIGNGVAMAMGC
jgi:metal-dependent amidase/aminoacylase/carboxypeptidase family protein